MSIVSFLQNILKQEICRCIFDYFSVFDLNTNIYKSAAELIRNTFFSL